jgi:hypothetical protein
MLRSGNSDKVIINYVKSILEQTTQDSTIFDNLSHLLSYCFGASFFESYGEIMYLKEIEHLTSNEIKEAAIRLGIQFRSPLPFFILN